MMDKNENKEMIEAVALLAKEKNIARKSFSPPSRRRSEALTRTTSTSSTAFRRPTRMCALSLTA